MHRLVEQVKKKNKIIFSIKSSKLFAVKPKWQICPLVLPPCQSPVRINENQATKTNPLPAAISNQTLPQKPSTPTKLTP